MLIKSNILFIIFAGLMNGSFVIPSRFIQNTSHEKTWIYHSVIGLVIIPWLILALVYPGAIHNYGSLSPYILLILVASGFIFGLGQVCFSYAIEAIGIALSFAINLGIGVTIGSMFLIFYNAKFFTEQSVFVIFSIIFIVCSLLIHYLSGRKHQSPHYSLNKLSYRSGWILAILTGLTSGLQNITFVIVAFHLKTLFQATNSFWVWPPFLTAAAIPMFLGFIYRINRNSPLPKKNELFLNFNNIILIALMGLFFTGSLAMYSSGMSDLPHSQQIIGWPAFMVSIIFASQIWGLLFKETRITSTSSKIYLIFSVVLLISAIILLASKA